MQNTEKILYKILIIISLFLLSCDENLPSQTDNIETGILQGNVYNNLNQALVMDAIVKADQFTTTTDSNGYYIIENIPVGSHNITVNKSGFDIGSRTIQILANDTLILNFNLSLARKFKEIAHISQSAWCVATTDNGLVYMGNSEGLWVYQYDGTYFTYITNLDNGWGVQWIALAPDGTIFTTNHSLSVNCDLSAYRFNGTVLTNAGQLYVGGAPEGIAINSEGTIFVANRHSTIIAYSYDGNSFTKIAGGPYNPYREPWGITIDTEGTIYLGSSDGLRAYLFKDSSFTNTAHIYDGGWANETAIGNDGTIFLANHDDGLRAYTYDNSSFTNTAHIFNAGKAWDVAIGLDNIIYVANDFDGLRAYTYNENSFTNIGHKTFGNYNAYQLAIGPDSTIFVAGPNDGLYAFKFSE